MLDLDALTNVPDPAWPELQAAIGSAKNSAELLPAAEGEGAKTLLALQVTLRSTLGALAFHTGGVSVAKGWLRVLGASGPRMSDGLLEWNGLAGKPNLVAGALIVGVDAAGGLFAANGGALSGSPGHIHYFAPDRLEWENLELGHTAFVEWALTGDVAQFYEGLQWPGWESDVARAGLDRAFHAHPPPWTTEGRDPAKVSRREVPSLELATLNFEMRRQLGPA